MSATLVPTRRRRRRGMYEQSRQAVTKEGAVVALRECCHAQGRKKISHDGLYPFNQALRQTTAGVRWDGPFGLGVVWCNLGAAKAPRWKCVSARSSIGSPIRPAGTSCGPSFCHTSGCSGHDTNNEARSRRERICQGVLLSSGLLPTCGMSVIIDTRYVYVAYRRRRADSHPKQPQPR
jgi:hypothetical protein